MRNERHEKAEYGRILGEATIRREVAAMGLRLESMARGEPQQIIDEVASALARIVGLDQRWQVSLGQPKEVDSDLIGVTPAMSTDGPSSPAAQTLEPSQPLMAWTSSWPCAP